MKSAAGMAGSAADEQAMEAVAAIERIASTARAEIQRLQMQVQRNLKRTLRDTGRLAEPATRRAA